MMAHLCAIVSTLVIFSIAFGEGKVQNHWALLVAGSNGYMNYRHQADVCHAYHVVRSHGIPDENIVVMMYDDIAYNKENPFKGNIINEPNGPNVYKGVKKDYTNQDVTPDVFLKVLTGDADGIKRTTGREGKVIKSGPNDHVFVYFADHGAPGLLAFPEDYLYAARLNNAIQKMFENKQYKEMVFYVEACESGSMFQHLLKKDMNVFVTTAANPDESSYACYYDDKRQTYLGDVYSVNWLQDSDVENLSKETLQQQYRLVKKETNTSHVEEYGDITISKSSVADFQGNKTQSTSLLFKPVFKRKYSPLKDAVPSEDVHMEILQKKFLSSFGDEKIRHRASLEELKMKKQLTEEFFKNIVSVSGSDNAFTTLLKSPLHFTDMNCYNKGIELIRDMCPGLDIFQNDYALRNFRVLANLCETNIPEDRIWATIGKVSFETMFCSHKSNSKWGI